MKKLFYTESYEYLANRFSSKFIKGKLTRKNFSDGESYARFDEDLKNCDVFILGGTTSDKDLMDIYDLACAASMYGSKSLNLIIPYYGYSTMERAVKKGEVVKAKTRVRILSSIPKAKENNTIFLFDLHVSGLVHYFENGTKSVHMYGKTLLDQVFEEVDRNNLMLASPDEGRAKWVSSLAQEYSLPHAISMKHRDGEKITNLGVNTDVTGKDILIYDDMIRSGNTIIEAAKNYKANGAKNIYVLASHGVFSSTKLMDSDLIEKVFVSNSHPRAISIQSSKLKILNISSIIEGYIDENL